MGKLYELDDRQIDILGDILIEKGYDSEKETQNDIECLLHSFGIYRLR